MPKTKILNSGRPNSGSGSGPTRFLGRASSSNLFTYAGLSSAALLAGLPVFLTLSPALGTKPVNAEVSETLGASATINSTLGLSADSISMVINPTSTGSVFKTGKTTATVSTNNETGYTLYLSDSDNNNSLSHSNLADKAINSIASATTGNNMLANTWGYTLGASEAEGESEVNNEANLALTYSPIPIERTAIKTREAAITTDSTPITFGIKVNTDIPSGVYSDQVSITAVANYSSTAYPDSNLWLDKNGVRITTMQQMTGSICASVPTPTVSATGANIPTITLTDTRDNKTYEVKKLADGNCWMTQSLAIAGIDADTPRILTPADSNVSANYPLSAAGSIGTSGPSKNVVYSSGVNDTVLYSFNTATAGKGAALGEDQSSTDDICPKGWHLPSNTGNASWDKLLRVGQDGYQIATSSDDYSTGKVSWGTFDGIKTATANPLGLQLTGGLFGRSLNLETTNGLYWSRTASSDSKAYHLDYDSYYITLQADNVKSNGLEARCVADVTTPANVTYMQEVTACPATLPKEKWYTLKDKRDNKEYTVARLADGNCWMTSSLAIAGIDADTPRILTPADSNVTTNWPLPAAVAVGDTSNTADTAFVSLNTDANNTMLYNFNAATAGSGGGTFVGTAPQDICPEGWHLPNGNGNASWNKLLLKGQGIYEIATSSNRYDASKVSWGTYGGIRESTNNPLGLKRTSGFWNSRFYGSDDGYYWTRTANSATNAYDFGYGSGAVYAQGSDGKDRGFAVRCVLE